MNIGVLKEAPPETRVSLLPAEVAQLKKSGFSIYVQENAGLRSMATDQEYQQQGAAVVPRDEVFEHSDILLSIYPFEDYTAVKSHQILIGTYNPWYNIDWLKKIQERGATVFSLDLVPRISRAQTMDVLSSMSTLAGHKAVLLAANYFPKIFPMMMTAAGTIRPASVLVLGAGVAGLQAIATARRLGAQVFAFDVRPEVKEEVESLGATFLDVKELAVQSIHGYAAEQTEEFHRKEQEILAEYIIRMDVLITTALTFGRKAPLLLPRNLVEQLKPGSVIVDLAIIAGGNCELSKADEVVVHNHVTILAPSNLPATVPFTASQMYGRNVANFLKLLIPDQKLHMNFEDPIIRDTCITYEGKILSPVVADLFEKQAGSPS